MPNIVGLSEISIFNAEPGCTLSGFTDNNEEILMHVTRTTKENVMGYQITADGTRNVRVVKSTGMLKLENGDKVFMQIKRPV